MFDFTENPKDALDRHHELAFFLHPDPVVAFQVLEHGIDLAQKTKKQLSRRPFSKDPHKLPFLERDLLHLGVLRASEAFELHEEIYRFDSRSNLSRYRSDYEPNADDVYLRIVKHLYVNSFDRHPRYFAIAEGVNFFRYKTIEILQLCDRFDNQNSSHIKKFFEKKLRVRFPYLDWDCVLVPDCNERTKLILRAAREQFVLPSHREQTVTTDINVITEYFGYDSNRTDRERQAVLMRHGIDRLINDYNSHFPDPSDRLEDPYQKLCLPCLTGIPVPSRSTRLEDRFAPMPLNRNERRIVEQKIRDSLPWISSEQSPSNGSKYTN
ncbi:MAG: hypothetical protein IPN69_21135 [Acidobacteria bacterium]|nr:hypothetical protein [Acidobacteriota bacterium]